MNRCRLSNRLRLAVFGANLDIRSFKRDILLFLLHRLYRRLFLGHAALCLGYLRNGSEHELLLFHLNRLRLLFRPVSTGFQLEFVDKAVLHHGVLHSEIHRIRHVFLVGEAHLRFCRVDVYIHSYRGKVYHQHAGREFSCHYHVGVGILQRR